MDVKRYPRFARPGHAVTGDRTRTHAEKRAALGHDFFHALVDDHSRLAYGELLADERAPTVTAFVGRALAWFAAHGITARRVEFPRFGRHTGFLGGDGRR
jgi:Integrase core domain